MMQCWLLRLRNSDMQGSASRSRYSTAVALLRAWKKRLTRSLLFRCRTGRHNSQEPDFVSHNHHSRRHLEAAGIVPQSWRRCRAKKNRSAPSVPNVAAPVLRRGRPPLWHECSRTRLHKCRGAIAATTASNRIVSLEADRGHDSQMRQKSGK